MGFAAVATGRHSIEHAKSTLRRYRTWKLESVTLKGSTLRVGDMAEEKRQWQAREMRLVSEFLAKYYPEYPSQTRVRLGSIHPDLEGMLSDAERRMVAGAWRRWADAIVFMPDRLILIEAAIRPSPGDISQLELYEHLLPLTPEFDEHKAKPIEKVLVFAIEDPVVASMARERGIRVIYFRPEWVEDYLKVLYPRERRAPLT